ncbi:response regulator [Paenibacillus sp. TRM 82003]|nr:response regulator [Paenibacillus sp. TRM 82003]
MKVILVDDEKAMHLIMSRMLAKLSGIEVVGAFQNTAAASAFLEQQTAHLAFVDIHMPQEDGMRFAERMAESYPRLHIVFVTSHKEYAMDAFDILALDYIVKPVSLERLGKTVRRALALHHYANPSLDEPVEHRVAVYGMGGLEVRSAQGSMVKWRSRKSAELFAYLLLHHGRMVSRAKLTADVFHGMPQKNAETYLNTAVYQLRKSLEPHDMKSLVLSDQDHYGMVLADVTIDFMDFEEKVKGFAAIDETNLEEALATEALYAGDLFGERGFLWALHDRERLAERYASFAKRLAKAIVQRQPGDPAAVRLLQKLRNANDLDEETVCLLFEVHTARRDRAALTELYGQHLNILRKELGISPTPELSRLYAKLSSSL